MVNNYFVLLSVLLHLSMRFANASPAGRYFVCGPSAYSSGVGSEAGLYRLEYKDMFLITNLVHVARVKQDMNLCDRNIRVGPSAELCSIIGVNTNNAVSIFLAVDAADTIYAYKGSYYMGANSIYATFGQEQSVDIFKCSLLSARIKGLFEDYKSRDAGIRIKSQ